MRSGFVTYRATRSLCSSVFRVTSRFSVRRHHCSHGTARPQIFILLLPDVRPHDCTRRTDTRNVSFRILKCAHFFFAHKTASLYTTPIVHWPPTSPWHGGTAFSPWTRSRSHTFRRFDRRPPRVCLRKTVFSRSFEKCRLVVDSKSICRGGILGKCTDRSHFKNITW